MQRSRNSSVKSHRYKLTWFRKSADFHLFLLYVVVDALHRMVGGDVSMALNALSGIAIFCVFLAPIASMFADLLFRVIDMLTRNVLSKIPPLSKHDKSSKDDPPPSRKTQRNRKHTSKGKGKSKGNKSSRGAQSTSDTRTTRVNDSPNSTGHSKSGTATGSASSLESKTLETFLARFAAEIRLQIFAFYFVSFRPKGYYRETFYRNNSSINLLTALKHGQSDLSLYYEALSEFQKSHQLGLLLEGSRIGSGFIDFIKLEMFQSLKDITFGPG